MPSGFSLSRRTKTEFTVFKVSCFEEKEKQNQSKKITNQKKVNKLKVIIWRQRRWRFLADI